MQNKKLIVANWKMNKTFSEACKFIEELTNIKRSFKCDVVICPPFLYLESLTEKCHKFEIKIGAQNCCFEENGAFTGEISANMLASLGIDYVILGHSERRIVFGETSEVINLKIKMAIKYNLKVILCVGETLLQRNSKQAISSVLAQLEEALSGLDLNNMNEVVIAYEPRWAIGTGKTVSTHQAFEMFESIRNFISLRYGDSVAKKIQILYGGSMNADNAQSFLNISGIDGGLIGGSSLNPQIFAEILTIGEKLDN